MESLHIIKGLWNLSNIGAENSDTRIKLERDSLGRVVKEWQDAHWISSRYDEMGERIETTSSFGASILTRRNEMGQAAQVIAYMDKERPWEAAMEYNALGQETSRLVSGGVYSSWKYDATGRPISHEVNLLQRGTCRQHNSVGGISGYSETKRRRSYEWDVSCQLKKVTNELTKGTTIFSYDQFSNLVSARESGFETIFRTTDTVGNLFKTQDNSDRIYGGGSRLEQSGIDLKEKRNKYQGGYGKLVTKGRKFFYDEEGNLAKKIRQLDGSRNSAAEFVNDFMIQHYLPSSAPTEIAHRKVATEMKEYLTDIVHAIDISGAEMSIGKNDGSLLIRKSNGKTEL